MTIYPAQLHGKSLLVLLVRTNAQLREEFAWFTGTVTYAQGNLLVDRGDSGPPLTIPPNSFGQIRPCDDAMARAFAASDFLLSLRLEKPEFDADSELFNLVGLNWEA